MLRFVFFSLILKFNQDIVSTRTIAKCSKSDVNPVIVETTTGKIKANCEHRQLYDEYVLRSANIYSWLGVPYAEPPIGKNRFEEPIPVKPWKNVLDATKWPKSCMQNDFDELKNEFTGYNMWKPKKSVSNYNEDCLYLNIWVRADEFLRRNSKLSFYEKPPILVFISGDDLTSGTSALDIYDPSSFVTLTGIIVVTINYRLGLFGHLHLKGHINGNQALLDQHLALKWIYENAEYFGGDPSRITLLGFGTGGSTLVGYHLLYKPSWQFFRNVILQSTSPFQSSLTPITSNEATKRAIKFAEYVGCGKPKMHEIVDCLKNRNSFVLSNATEAYLTYNILKGNTKSASYIMTYFPPVIDGSVINDIPSNSFTENNFKNCSILMGFNKNEASMIIDKSELPFYKPNHAKRYTLNQLKTFLEQYFDYFPYYPAKITKSMIQNITDEYTKHITRKNYPKSILDSVNYMAVLNRIITHESFACNILRLADRYIPKNDVYVYSYTYRVTTSPWNMNYETVHGDELAMLFAHVVSSKHQGISTNPWTKPQLYTNEERDLCHKMINYWSNFISNDNPNVAGEFSIRDNKEEWPLYRSRESFNKINIINFTTHKLSLIKNPIYDRCQFWNDLF